MTSPLLAVLPATQSRHFIIGTAGHVDHGKTSLIRALTGTDTDRLREERERGMSIDLGFADFRLPSGRHAGVIDVPGHERFLKNMLAGAGGIDLVLLVIAADEGVMPQTREHLEILSLLQTRRGVVVLTKADRVDPEWLELITEEVREYLKPTFLRDAPIMPVDSLTRAGLPELAAELDRQAERVPTRSIVGPWRLPIDRAFTIGGFGTVVTGTLVAGVARVGDRVELLPSGLETRIRGLQVHGASVPLAEAGTRVAMNLAGVDTEQVARGEVAAPPASYAATLALDARLDVLPSCPREIKHRMRVRVYLGTAEVLARLNLLDQEVLLPGESGLVQLRLEAPLQAGRGDRYVLRLYSPMETLGGGTVLDVTPTRHRRFTPSVLENLRLKEKGSPADQVADAAMAAGLVPANAATLAARAGMPADQVRTHLDALIQTGLLLPFPNETVLHRHRLEAAAHLLETTLTDYHAQHPMRTGMSREELRSRVSRQLETKAFNLVMGQAEAAGRLVTERGRTRLAAHAPRFTPEQQAAVDHLQTGLLADPFNPPGQAELCSALPPLVADTVWDALMENGTVVRLAKDVYLHRQAVDEAISRVRAYIPEHGPMTAAQFRDLIGTTRKFAVPLLEWLDSQRITRRFGDVRELS